MGKKIRYNVRFRSDTAPKGGYTTMSVEGESESDAINKVRKSHPKATEIVAKPS
jgi:hypothetical protein